MQAESGDADLVAALGGRRRTVGVLVALDTRLALADGQRSGTVGIGDTTDALVAVLADEPRTAVGILQALDTLVVIAADRRRTPAIEIRQAFDALVVFQVADRLVGVGAVEVAATGFVQPADTDRRWRSG